MLKQNRISPIDVEKQVCIFYAVTHDYLTDVHVEDIGVYEKGLYERMDAQYKDVLTTIATTGALDSETEEKLKSAIAQYTTDFLKDR